MKAPALTLLWQLFRQDLHERYAGTVLGVFWLLIPPLFMLLVYALVFGEILQMRLGTAADTGQFTAWLFTGLTVFNALAEVLTRAPAILTERRELLLNSPLPPALLPLLPVGSSLVLELLSVGLLLLWLSVQGRCEPQALLFYPPFLLLRLLFSLAFAYGLAVLGVFLRDLRQMMPPLLTVLLLVSPIVYPLSVVPVQFQAWFGVESVGAIGTGLSGGIAGRQFSVAAVRGLVAAGECVAGVGAVAVPAVDAAGEVCAVSDDWAIRLQGAGVAYRRYAHPRDALLEWVLRRGRHADFHALQDLNLSLRQGDSLGVVGDNGAGKSTLLKMLAGNLPPTAGVCEIRGRRSALLELGAGLQPEFSGIDNARMGLALRGLAHAEIERQLPQVLAFAELGEFAHQPVKTYSSGMVVRLVFAVAAVIEPQVLIVDEALSVGDQYFQKKSLDRMRAILKGGATLVFCSHNLYQVREICRQAVWLEQGRVRMLGDAQQVVDAYQDVTRSRNAVGADPRVCPLHGHDQSGEGAHGGAPLLLDVTLNRETFQTHEPFTLHILASQGNRPLSDVHVGIVIRRNDDVQCYGISTLHDGVQMQAMGGGVLAATFTIERLPLLSGEYCLEVWLIDASGVHVYDSRERCCHFRVQQAGQQQGVGMVCLPHRWGEVEHVVAS